MTDHTYDKEVRRPTPIEWILKYWVVLVFLVMSIGAWVTLSNKVESHTDSIKSLHAADVTAAALNNQVLVELSGIRADLMWLKANLNK